MAQPPVRHPARYLVGGAVRDGLLGLPVKDRDYVVVGATASDMLAQGFVPVGRDFPVFLHPQTHEEHALARTERKSAPGYRGFVFHADADVTLEEDLARRDLTVNAMARAEDGTLVDPFGGQADLRERILRHVSPAFVEDPVRILRVARFAARFTDFALAPETALLMRAMVAQGEADALVPERVWQEFSRGLMEAIPSRMIHILQTCGALARLLPEISGLAPAVAARTLTQLDAASRAGAMLPVRLAVLLQAAAPEAAGVPEHGRATTAPIEAACGRLKAPGDCRDLAVMTARERDAIRGGAADPAAMIALLERCDALRKPERFDRLLEAISFLEPVTGGAIPDDWRHALAAAGSVDAGAIARAVRTDWPGEPMRINEAVRSARLSAIAAARAGGRASQSAN